MNEPDTALHSPHSPHSPHPPGHAGLPVPAETPRFGRAVPALALLALYFFFSFYRLAELPLLDPDEPRYAAAGRSMARGGSWIIPVFNGKPRINKPPLFYWLVALSDKLWGRAGEVSARLPSIVMGLLMLGLTVGLGRRLYDARTALWAGLILVSAPLFLGLSRACVTDQTFSTLLAGALACLLLGLTGRWPWRACSPVLAAGLLMGLAFMAKGTAALIVLLAPFVFVLLFAPREFLSGPGKSWASIGVLVGFLGLGGGWLLRAVSSSETAGRFGGWVWVCSLGAFGAAFLSVTFYGLRRFWKRSPWRPALLLALLLAAWWYGLLIQHFGWLEFKRLLQTEILGRLSGKMHREPPFYYTYVMLGLFFPWSAGLIPALGLACRRVTDPLPLGSAGGADAAERPSPEAVHRVADAFLAAWLVAVLLFFSIPGAKLVTYVLPAFPAAALLVARFLSRLQEGQGGEGRPVGRGWRWAALGFAILLSEALIVLGLGPHPKLQGLAGKHALPGWAIAVLAALVLALLAGAGDSARRLQRYFDAAPGAKRRRLDLALALSAPVLLSLLAGAVLIPTRILQLPRRWQGVLEASPVPLWGIAGAFFLLACLPWIMIALQRRIRTAALVMAAFVTLTIAFLLPRALPDLNRRSSKNLSLQVAPWVRRAKRVYAVGGRKESLAYYLDRPVIEPRRPKRSAGETPRSVVLDALRGAPPGQAVLFVHHRYFSRWLRGRPPAGSRRIGGNARVIVLLNEAPPGRSSK